MSHGDHNSNGERGLMPKIVYAPPRKRQATPPKKNGPTRHFARALMSLMPNDGKAVTTGGYERFAYRYTPVVCGISEATGRVFESYQHGYARYWVRVK